MTIDPAKLFAEAWELAKSDRGAAVELFKQVVDAPAGPLWGDAQLEVAGWAHQQYELDDARRRFQSIIDAEPSVRSDQAWRTAAVMLNSVLDDLDQPVDRELLRRGLEACAAAHHEQDEYLAGIASSHLARLALADGRRDIARELFTRAEAHYNASGSMIGGPGVALEIAKLLAAEGAIDDARATLRRGLEHLARFPHAGRNVRELRERLEAFESEIR